MHGWSRQGCVDDPPLGDDSRPCQLLWFRLQRPLHGLRRCWTHLLREIHALKAQHPDDAKLRRWAVGVKAMYTKADATHHRDPRKRYGIAVAGAFAGLSRPYADDSVSGAGQAVPPNREVHRATVRVRGRTGCEPDNNGSERSLRISVSLTGAPALRAGPSANRRVRIRSASWRSERATPSSHAAKCSFGCSTLDSYHYGAACDAPPPLCYTAIRPAPALRLQAGNLFV